MRLHKNLLDALLFGLSKVFFDKNPAEFTLAKIFKKNKKWGSHDRSFVAEHFYEMIRHKRLIEYRGGFLLQRENIWVFIATHLALQGFEVFSYFPFFDFEKIKKEENSKDLKRKIRYSIPDWLDSLGEIQLGELWERELHLLNQKAPLVIRVNTLKITRKKLVEHLKKENIEASLLENHSDGLLIKKRTNLLLRKTFRQGFFEIQDASSQEVVPFLGAKKGMHIIDACAGAGGKSLHLASFLQNQAKITALDISISKLKELEKRKNRAGAHCIETRLIKEKDALEEFYESADRLLLDVPCSKLGVLRRHPDLKWNLSPEILKKILELQAKILSSYAKFLKIGGKMLYSTCSVLPMENQQQIEKFLDSSPSYQALSQKTIFSHTSGFDGFFMALIKRIK